MHTRITKTTDSRASSIPQKEKETRVESLISDYRPEAIAQGKLKSQLMVSPKVSRMHQQQQIIQKKDLLGQSSLLKPAAYARKRSDASSHVVQRAINDVEYARLDHSMMNTGRKTMAQLTRDTDNVNCLLKRQAAPAAGFEIASADDQTWRVVTVANLKAQYSWPNENIHYTLPSSFETDETKQKQVKTKGADTIPVAAGGAAGALTISEFAGDDLAMVHHTTGGGGADHLTVENAHISAMHHIKDMRTISGFDKGGKTKPEHETLMKAYESTAVDNLNFYGAEGRDVIDLSLSQYLNVIKHAMDHIDHVPPVYGVEVIRSANEMARQKGMNPVALFLPAGAGQDRHLFKAAMNMNKMGLIHVPAGIVTAFEGYDQPSPTLKNAEGGEVREGDADWSALQQSLIDDHLAALLTYLKTLA